VRQTFESDIPGRPAAVRVLGGAVRELWLVHFGVVLGLLLLLRRRRLLLVGLEDAGLGEVERRHRVQFAHVRRRSEHLPEQGRVLELLAQLEDVAAARATLLLQRTASTTVAASTDCDAAAADLRGGRPHLQTPLSANLAHNLRLPPTIPPTFSCANNMTTRFSLHRVKSVVLFTLFTEQRIE
jgi:hypothetical protein